jgi:dihydrofolate synthase/folylpolyglutamate synthase
MEPKSKRERIPLFSSWINYSAFYPMNYTQTLQYMYSQLPMFHRIGNAAYKANLDNTIAICGILDNPQNNFSTIHIAGTNGKGSTSHLIASILQSSGYKVGLYTSPHLKDFRERIRVNGKMVPRKFVSGFVGRYKNEFDRIQPSFFEMTVGMAFAFFSEQKVDIAVIEAGLGGRLDSTNIITPLLSVITNISYDHQHLLGDTLPLIAAEKAGIIKEGVPVVIGETEDESKQVFLDKAKACRSEIYFADELYKLRNYRIVKKNGTAYLCADVYRRSKLIWKNARCELTGAYQLKNISTVLMAIDVLNRKGNAITDEAILTGIERVISQTGLKGRWQVISKNPLTISDTGHNEAGIREVLKQLKRTPHEKLHFILGMVNDKEISKVLRLLPRKAIYYFCRPAIPRGLDPLLLQKEALDAGLKGKAYTSVKRALKAAQASAARKDLVFVGGSTFVVAEIL